VETVSQAGDRQTEEVVKTPTPHHASSSVPEPVQSDRKEEPVALGSQGQIAVAERSQQQSTAPVRQVDAASTAEIKTPAAASSMQGLLEQYHTNPKSLNAVAKVNESAESIDLRLCTPFDYQSPEIVEASNPDFIIVQGETPNQGLLLPRHDLKVTQYSYGSIKELFESHNFQKQPTKFQVQQPAIVERSGNSWQLVSKGKMEFADKALQVESGVPKEAISATAPAPPATNSGIPGLDHSRTPNGEWSVTRQQETTNRTLMSEAQKALNRLAVSQPAGDRAYQGNGFSLSERGGVTTVEVASTKTKVEQRGEVITGNAQPKDVQNFKEINARLAANRPHTAEKSQELEL
jgi:hypothetical protein